MCRSWDGWMTVVAWVGCLAGAAIAQTEWTNAGGGAYNNPSNWNPANVPDTITETPRFNLADKYTVTFPGASSFTVNDLLVDDGTVIFSVAGGLGADATVNLTDDLTISGAELALTRDGTGLDVNLNIPDLLTVQGGGTFNIFDGAQVNTDRLDLDNAGGGTITLDGIASDLFINTLGNTNIGLSGNSGEINLTDAADLTMAGNLSLASSGVTGSSGVLNVNTNGDAKLQSLTVGAGSGTGITAIVDIDGAGSSVSQGGTASLLIGDAGNSATTTARVRADNNGVFTTGTGGTTIRGQGRLELATGGTFIAKADITAEGPDARVVIEDGANLNLDANTLRLQDGAQLVLDGVLNLTGGSEVIEVLDPSIIDGTTGGLNLRNGSQVFLFDPGAVLNTGTAASTVGTGSRIEIDGGATMNVEGDLTVDGGTIFNVGGFGDFNLSPNTDITLQNGGVIDSISTLSMQENTNLVIDGGGSGINFNGLSGIAFSQTITAGSLTVRNNAVQGMSFLTMGGFLTSGAADVTVNIESDAEIVVSNSLGLNGSAGGTGVNTLNLSDGFLTYEGSSSAQLGNSSNTGTQFIADIDDGTFRSLVGDVRIYEQATVNLSNNGRVLAEIGDIFVEGGAVQADPATGGFIGFAVANEGQSMTVRHGGTVTLHGGGYSLVGQNLIVDGPGSSFSVLRETGNFNPATFWTIAFNGNPETTVQFINGGTGTFEDFNLGGDTNYDGHVQADINTGGVVHADNLAVGSIYFTPSSEWVFSGDADLNIDGVGSRFNVSAGDAYIGSSTIDGLNAGYTGEVTLTNDGTLDVSGGTLNLGYNAQVNVHGGHLLAGAINQLASTSQIDFQSGAITLGSGLTVDNTQPLGPAIDLPAGKALSVGGALTIPTGRMVSLTGGELTVASFAGGGTFDFQSGGLTVTGTGGLSLGPAGPLGVSQLALGAGQSIRVPNGVATVESGLTLAVADAGVLAAQDMQNNGTLILDGLLASVRVDGVLTNAGLARGTGTIHASLTNAHGGEVRVRADETLTITNAAHANSGQLTLLGGELAFGGTLSNNADGDIFGRGTLITDGLTNQGDVALSNGQTDVFGDVTNIATGRVIISGNADVTFWDDFENQGTSASVRVSAGSSATFFGAYAGAGASGGGEVFFEADVTPGFSPGVASFGGDVTFSPLARLVSELSAGDPGSDYDQLAVAGHVELAGELQLQLLGGYSPSLGDLFTLIDAATVTGTFDSIDGIPLGIVDGFEAGLAVVYSPTDLIARVSILGDANFDDQVNVVDLGILASAWQGAGDWSDADFNGDGLVNVADLGAIASNWQAGVSGSAMTFTDAWAAVQTDVPEPASLAMLALGGLAMLRRRRGRASVSTA